MDNERAIGRYACGCIDPETVFHSELNAMHECYNAVQELDHAARFRVVDWLADRLRSERKNENTP